MSIETTPATSAEVALTDITVSETNKIFRDPADFTPESLKELADSIAAAGLVQPVLLRPHPKTAGKYILVAGERRFRSFQLLKAPAIPSYIRDIDEDQAFKLQVIENLQREDVKPMKEARAFDGMIREKKYTTASIAAQIGKSIDYVQDRLRLVALIPQAQDMIAQGYLPLKAGLKLARIPDKKQQLDCLEHCTTLNGLHEEFDLNGSQVRSNDLPFKKTERVIFKGLDRMQEWMDRNLFTDLTRADFDKEDPKLNPAMGACSGCRNRTKNSQGLFDDIIVDDKCLLSSCYRTKQINTYKQLREELKKKFPKAKIIFKRRDNSIDGRSVFDKELQGLGELVGAGSGEIIADKKGQAMTKPTIAILVGISHSNDTDNDKRPWVYWQPTQKKTRSVDPRQRGELTEAAKKQLSPEQQAAAERKIQDGQRKEAILDEVMLDIAIDQVLKTQNEDKVLDMELEALLEHVDSEFTDGLPRIFQRLGLNFWNGKKEISHKGFDTIAHRVEQISAAWNDRDRISDADILKTLEKASIAQKRVVLIMGRALSYYSLATKAEKLFQIPSESARKQKASGKAGEIFKKFIADRDAKALQMQKAKLDIYKGMGDGAIRTKDAAKMLEDLKPIGIPAEEARAKAMKPAVAGVKVKAKKKAK